MAAVDHHQGAGTLQTAVLLAYDQADLELVERLVKAGAPLNVRDLTGTSPLHLCSARNLLDLARVLLDAGADPNLRNHQRGSSALASLPKRS